MAAPPVPRPPARPPARGPVAPRPALPRRSRPRRWLVALIVLVLVLGGALTVAAVVRNRVERGTWELPEPGEVVRILKGRPPEVAKVIVLERDALTLSPGLDDAPRGVSSVVGASSQAPVKVPGWKGTDKAWREVVACVADLFAPFDVTVTDQRPARGPYALVAVGGKPADIGVKNKRVGGLAPFNGEVIANPVVFAFAGTLGHKVRSVCETIGMEVAHAYGLDHGYDCKDVMTYLPSCGPKRFLDKAIPCGEKKPRACEGGAPTQNSFAMLAAALGRRPAAPTPPARR